MKNNRINFLINISYYIVIIALCYVIIRFGLPLFWPFLGGLVLAFLFKRISRAIHAGSKASMAVIGIAFYAAVVLIFWIIFVLLAGWLVSTAQQFPQFYNESMLPAASQAFEKMMELMAPFSLDSGNSAVSLFGLATNALGEFVTRFSSTLISVLTSFFSRMPMFLIGFIFMIVSSFAISMDYPRVINFMVGQLPPKIRPLIFDVKNFLESCLFKIIKAYAIIMLITFSELCLGLWALRIEGFWRVAAIIAVLDILPIIGSGTVLIPWALYNLISGNFITGIGLAIIYAIVAIIRNIIEPRIVGEQLGLHPVATLAAMFLGLRLFGLLGMILAPVTALLIQFLNDNAKLHIFKSNKNPGAE